MCCDTKLFKCHLFNAGRSFNTSFIKIHRFFRRSWGRSFYNLNQQSPPFQFLLKLSIDNLRLPLVFVDARFLPLRLATCLHKEAFVSKKFISERFAYGIKFPKPELIQFLYDRPSKLAVFIRNVFKHQGTRRQQLLQLR